MAAFRRDHDLGFLFLFEGRRVRGHDIALSKGFLAFYELFHELIRKGQEDGSFRSDVSVSVLGSALLGLFLYLVNGVTTVRNMTGSERDLRAKGELDSGKLIGPRYYTSGCD